jgi:glycosyltransferase involved in cell wall biosynthesis
MNTSSRLPLVSIVIATYNGEAHLQEQLDSIAAQTYPSIEVIAIDDGSTDGTIGILERYREAHPETRIIRNEKNLGYQKNFEKGFTFATGRYIAPCDQDDIWLPEKIATLVDQIGEHAIAYCDSQFIDANGNPTGGYMNGGGKVLMDFDDPLMYVVGASAPGHAMIIDRQVAMDAMPYPTILCHDNWIAFVATFHSSLKFVDKALVQYRRHENNATAVKSKLTRVQLEEKARAQVKLFHDKCPDSLPEHKRAFYEIWKSYESYSFANNFSRMRLFFKYRKKIFAYKRRKPIRLWLYSLKSFFKILVF